MSKYKTWVPGLTFVIIAAMVVLGCSAPFAGPSRAEVGRAFQALASATSSASFGTGPGSYGVTYPYTFSDIFVNPSGGSASAAFTSSTDPYAGPCSVGGTITFADWVEPAFGYTINGTLSVFVNSSVALDSTAIPRTLSTTLSCDLTLSGGPISTLSCDVAENITITNAYPGYYGSATGTVTANGYRFDLAELQAH